MLHSPFVRLFYLLLVGKVWIQPNYAVIFLLTLTAACNTEIEYDENILFEDASRNDNRNVVYKK
jgi:hypothetical protein